MKIIAGKVTTERDIVAEKDFLNVPWTIVEDDGTLVHEGNQAFDLTASAQEVGDFLTRKLATYKENLAIHEGAKELQAALDNGQEVAGQITNLEISE